MNNRSIKLGQYLAALIIAALPLYYVKLTILHIPTNVIEILVLLLFIVTILSASKDRLLKIPYSFQIGLIILGIALGCIVSVDHQAAFGILKGWFVVPIVFFWCVNALFGVEDIDIIGWAALVSLLSVSIYALLQWVGLIGATSSQGSSVVQYVSQHRAAAFYESPNFLAMYLAPLIVFSYGLLQTKAIKIWWCLLVLALPVIMLLATQSRAGVLALLAGLLVLIFTQALRGGAINKKTSIMVLTISVVLVSIILFYRGFDSDGHLFIWQTAINIGARHPIFGIGPGQFQHYFLTYNDGTSYFANLSGYAIHPHNIFLNYWLSGGLLAIVGFIWLLISVCRDMAKSTSRVTIAAWAAIISVLVHGLFDSTYFKNDLAIIFWLLVAIIYLTKNEMRTNPLGDPH